MAEKNEEGDLCAETHEEKEVMDLVSKPLGNKDAACISIRLFVDKHY